MLLKSPDKVRSDPKSYRGIYLQPAEDASSHLKHVIANSTNKYTIGICVEFRASFDNFERCNREIKSSCVKLVLK